MRPAGSTCGQWLLAVMLFVAPAARAAEDAVTLDLAGCRARAVAAAPEIAVAEADLRSGTLAVGIAGAAALPAVRAEGGYLRSSVNHRGVTDFAANNGESEYTARAVVSQPLFAGGALLAGRRQAEAQAAGARQGLTATRAEILLAADRAFYGSALADERRTIATAGLEAAADLLRAARVRLANGEIPAFDADKLELEVANASAALDEANAAADIARAELAAIVQVPADAIHLDVNPTDPTAIPAPLEPDVARVLAERPDLQRLEAAAVAAEAAIGIARGARLPQVNAEAAAGWDSLHRPDGANAGWQAGVTVSVPLWDWKGLARREEIARLEAEKARRQLEAAQRAVRTEVVRRHHELRLAAQRFANARTAEGLALRNAATARRGYELGLVSALDLVTAQRQATTARADRAAARYSALLATSEYDFSTGSLR